MNSQCITIEDNDHIFFRYTQERRHISKSVLPITLTINRPKEDYLISVMVPLLIIMLST